MTETIVRKFNRRIHLLALVSPYVQSQEVIAMLAIADLGRSCESFIERLSRLK